MTPTFEAFGVMLYLGNAAFIVPRLTVDVDLLATDPPYGIGYQSSYRTEPTPVITGDRGDVDVSAIIASCLPRLGRMRHVYVFGPDDVMRHERLTSHAELIWDKGVTGMGNLSSPWGPAHERITFAIHAPWRGDRSRGKLSARLRSGSVIHVPRCGSKHIRHPNEKPVGLMRQLIESSTIVGETVLDPFCGSGSTLIAAMLSGRRAVGVECDERYFNIAVERVNRLGPLIQQLEAA